MPRKGRGRGRGGERQNQPGGGQENIPIYMGGTNTTEYNPPKEESFGKTCSHLMAVSRYKRHSNNADSVVIGGIVEISPATSVFLNEYSLESKLTLTSVSSTDVAYTVKSNKIKCYSVDKAYGILKAKSSVEITIKAKSGFCFEDDMFLIMAAKSLDANLSIKSVKLHFKSTTSILLDTRMNYADETYIRQSISDLNIQVQCLKYQYKIFRNMLAVLICLACVIFATFIYTEGFKNLKGSVGSVGDSKYYEAEIMDVHGDNLHVKFIGYDDEQETLAEYLRMSAGKKACRRQRAEARNGQSGIEYVSESGVTTTDCEESQSLSSYNKQKERQPPPPQATYNYSTVDSSYCAPLPPPTAHMTVTPHRY